MFVLSFIGFDIITGDILVYELALRYEVFTPLLATGKRGNLLLVGI